MLIAPKGSGITLFRATRGNAWKRCNSVQRFLKLKNNLNLPNDRCIYTCRHMFARRTHSGYYAGRPETIEVLAGLLSNTPKVCWDHIRRLGGPSSRFALGTRLMSKWHQSLRRRPRKSHLPIRTLKAQRYAQLNRCTIDFRVPLAQVSEPSAGWNLLFVKPRFDALFTQ